MNEKTMKQDFVLHEQYPPSKIMWIPAGALGVETNSRDILATSSDILRLYDFTKDELNPGGHFRLNQTVLMRNESEFSNPISSFDWNYMDPSKIAVSSIDSTVTILDINKQSLTT